MPRSNSPGARMREAYRQYSESFWSGEPADGLSALGLVMTGAMSREEFAARYPSTDEDLEMCIRSVRDGIADAFVGIRLSMRLTQREFGERIGVTQSAVSELERVCFTPNPIQLARFAYCLDLPFAILLGSQRIEAKFPEPDPEPELEPEPEPAPEPGL